MRGWAVGLVMFLIVGACGETGDADEAGFAQAGSIAVTEAWTRPAAAGGNTAIYMTIDNRGAALEMLQAAVGVACESTELQMTTVQDDIMSGSPVGGGFAIDRGANDSGIVLRVARNGAGASAEQRQK